MNAKDIVTKKNKDKIIDFFKDSVDYLVAFQAGCCKFNLDDKLAIFVGWSAGFSGDDDTVIHAKDDPTWAIDAAIKIRNDSDFSDFEYLNFPYNKETGDCWINNITMPPAMKTKDLRNIATFFLKTFVEMVNNYKNENWVFTK